MRNSSRADLFQKLQFLLLSRTKLRRKRKRSKPKKNLLASFHSTPVRSQMPSLASNTRIDWDSLRTMLFIILALLAGLMTMTVLIKLWNRRRRKLPASCKLTKSYPGCNFVQGLIRRIRINKSSHPRY